MILSDIVTYISTNSPSLNQVALADGLDRATIDTSSIIYGLIKDAVSGEAYYLKLPEKISYPALVYQLVSSSKIKIGKIDIFQKDIFTIIFKSNSFNNLVGLRETLRNSLLAYSEVDKVGVIEITDEVMDYNEKAQHYECALELEITHLMDANQSMPLVLLYHEQDKGVGKPNCGKQTINHQINLIIVSLNSEIEALRQEIKDCMIGYQHTPQSSEAPFLGGTRAGSTGNLIVWEDAYQITEFN